MNKEVLYCVQGLYFLQYNTWVGDFDLSQSRVTNFIDMYATGLDLGKNDLWLDLT